MVQRSIFEGLGGEGPEQEAQRPEGPSRSIFEGLQPPEERPPASRPDFSRFPFDPTQFGAPAGGMKAPEIPWYRRALGEGGPPPTPPHPSGELGARTRLPMAGAVGYEPQPREEMQGWQGPEPEAATRFKRFMGESLLFPDLSENVEQRIRVAQDRPPEYYADPDTGEKKYPGLFTAFEGGPPPDPYAFHEPGDVEAGVTLAATDFVERMTEPANLAFLAAVPIAFQIPAIKALATTGIATSVLLHTIQTTPEAIERFKRGDIEGGVRLVTEMALEAPIGLLSARSAYRTTKRGLIDPIFDLRGRRAAEAAARQKPVVTQRATEPPGAPQVEPQVIDVAAREVVPGEPAVTPEGLRPRRTGLPERPVDPVVPEDYIRGLTAERTPAMGRPPSPLEEPIVTPVRAVTPPEPGQDVFTVEKIPDQPPGPPGEWGVFMQQKGEGPRELVRQFRIKPAAEEFAEQARQRGMRPVEPEVTPAVTPEEAPPEPTPPREDQTKVDVFEPPEGEAIKVKPENLKPGDRYHSSEFGQMVTVEKIPKGNPDGTVRISHDKGIENTARSTVLVNVTRPRPAGPKPGGPTPATEGPVFEKGPPMIGDSVYDPKVGYGRILDEFYEGGKPTHIRVRFNSGEIREIPWAEVEKYRKAAERKAEPAEPTVKPPESVWTVEKLDDLKWAVYRKDIGYRKRKMAEYTTRQQALDHRARGRAVKPTEVKAEPRVEAPGADRIEPGVVVSQERTGQAPRYGRVVSKANVYESLREGEPEISRPMVNVQWNDGTMSQVPESEVNLSAGKGEAIPKPDRIRDKGKGKLSEAQFFTGDTVWFKGKKKGMISTLTADGQKATVMWDPELGGGQRTVLVSNLSKKPPKGEVAAPAEPKVGLPGPGNRQTIPVGPDKDPRFDIQFERDTEGNITARILEQNRPSGSGSKWIELKGRSFEEVKLEVFNKAKQAFIRKELKAAPKATTSATERELAISESWNDTQELILTFAPGEAPRIGVVARERRGTGRKLDTYEWGVRPDLVQGKLGWRPVLRKDDGVWTSGGISRVPNLTAEGYDRAVRSIHDRLADPGHGQTVEFFDPVAKELEATRLQEIDEAKTAKELEKATAEKQRKARREKAESRAQVARTAFKEIKPKQKPTFVEAVQHRKVLKDAGPNAYTFVKDGIATSSDGSITVMTRTDLADGVYSPYVKGDNKAFRKLKVASGELAKAPDPVAAEGKQGRITIDAKSSDLLRVQRVLKTVEPGRYALSSFQIEPREGINEIRIISTDGHRLVINTIPYEGKIKEGENWLVDGRALDAILKEKKGGKIELLLDQDTVTLVGQNIAVSNTRQGQFPSWEQVVPKSIATELVVSKQDLTDILKKAKIEQNDAEPYTLYFTRTPEGLDVQVHFDTRTKLEVIAQKHGTGSDEWLAQLKKQKEDPKDALVPEYGSIGTIPFTQRKPDLTKSKSEITVQMPIQDKDVPSEFNFNRKYLEDIVAGIRDSDVVLLGMGRITGEKPAVFTGSLETPPKTTTGYKPPKKKPKGSTGAMAGRLPGVDEATIQRIGDKAGATEQQLDRALSRSWMDEQHLEEWFAAQKISGPERIKAGAAAKNRAIERQKLAEFRARREAGEPIVEQEAEAELTGEERLLEAIGGKKKPPRGGGMEKGLGPDVRPVRGPGQKGLRRKTTTEPPVTPEGQLKLKLDVEDEQLTAMAEEGKRLGEGAMAGRMDRPGPPGRKPPPPMPPKPPPAGGGGEPPEPPGAALAEAERMTAGTDPEKPGFLERVVRFPERMQRLFTSEFQPLKHAEDRVYKEQSRELPILNMARKFELQAGAHGKAALDVLEFQEKVLDLIPKGKKKDFNTYVALERIRTRLLDNPQVKRVKGWSVERADRAIHELHGKIGSRDFEIIRAVAHHEYQEVMDRALQLQVVTGRISEKMYRDIKKSNAFYAPFKILQVNAEIEGLPGTGRNIADTQTYTRAITGIDDEDVVFENILEESARMVYRSRILAEKNLKMLALDELMLMGGKKNPFKKADPDRYYQIHYKPAEDILHQLAMQETQRGGRQTLEHSLVKVGRAIELADSVGLKLKKRNLRASLGRATLGGVDVAGGRINLMAFTSDVIAHELGHSFDVPIRDAEGKIIYKEKKVFGEDRSIVQRLSTVINLRKGVAFGKQGIYQKELAALVKDTKLGGTPQYRAKATERFAEFVNLYIHDPKRAKSLAPQWTEYFEKEILPKEKIKNLIERLGKFFQKADELPNIMDELKDMGGLKYIELAVQRAFPERKPQLGVRFGTQPKKGEEILQYFKEGKRQAMLTDTEHAQAVRGLHREEATQVARVLSQASLPMRLGATAANAAFQTVNLLAADLPRAALLSRYGIRNPKDIYRFPGDWVYSLYTAFGGNVLGKPNKLYKEFLASGLANSAVQRAITPATFDPTVERHWMKRVLDTIPKLSSAIEETSKILGLKRAFRIEEIEKYPVGSPERQEIMDYMVSELRNYSGSPDFLRRGQLLSGAGPNLNLLYVFLNARIQGNVSDIGRLLGATGKKERNAAWARLAPWLLAMTTLALYNRLPGNREDHEKRADWELENYFMFYRHNPDGTPMYITNERGEKIRAAYRWPKREITQLLGNFIEASVEFADKRDPEALRDYAVSFLENISPIAVSGNNMQERVESVASGLNPLFKLPIEFGLGRDTFRHRAVVPQYIEGVPSRTLSPTEQYTRTTPEQYVAASQLIKQATGAGISPLILEQMVRGATAGLITQFTPRPRPGRSKVLELPLIGPIASRYVGSEYLATEPDELLEAALVRQGDRQVRINRKAEQIAAAWNSEDPKPYSMREFLVLQGGTVADHFSKVEDILEDIRLGLNYTDRLVKQLQIGNGERAKYIAQKAVELPLGEERSTYLRELQRKKILTDAVTPQMNAEIRRLESGEPTVQTEQ